MTYRLGFSRFREGESPEKMDIAAMETGDVYDKKVDLDIDDAVGLRLGAVPTKEFAQAACMIGERNITGFSDGTKRGWYVHLDKQTDGGTFFIRSGVAKDYTAGELLSMLVDKLFGE